MSDQKESINKSVLKDLGLELDDSIKESTTKVLSSLTPEEERILRKDYGIGKIKPVWKKITKDKPVTSAWQHSLNFPEMKTPHTGTRPVYDIALNDLNSRHDKGKFSQADWEAITQFLASYIADVCEGAGFIYQGSKSYLGLRRQVEDMLKYRFKVRDRAESGDTYYDIKVEEK